MQLVNERSSKNPKRAKRALKRGAASERVQTQCACTLLGTLQPVAIAGALMLRAHDAVLHSQHTDDASTMKPNMHMVPHRQHDQRHGQRAIDIAALQRGNLHPSGETTPELFTGSFITRTAHKLGSAHAVLLCLHCLPCSCTTQGVLGKNGLINRDGDMFEACDADCRALSGSQKCSAPQSRSLMLCQIPDRLTSAAQTSQCLTTAIGQW